MNIKIALLFISAFSYSFCNADELKDRMAFWETKAFSCNAAGVIYPSKEHAVDPNSCDDGDMTLFNGLLCASGDARGCDAVKNAQGIDGRWWRSPGKIGVEARPGTKDEASFSPDMALGVWLYVTTEKNSKDYQRWVHWLDAERPCIATLGNTCVVKGWPRVCRDDALDKRCTFRPTTCNLLEIVGKNLSVPEGELCRKVLRDFKIRDDYILPTAELAAADGLFNQPGYPMHLAAVQIFLLERIGLTSVYTRTGAAMLALRDMKNPFFLFLSEGPTERVRELVLEQCPSPGRPSVQRSQWSWERSSGEAAWRNSMYWDCIFMGHLLGY